ncbi:MAG TPA: aminotransferase class V-fold PLP-dependent enzyme [Acidobacteriota bacterium]
MARIQIDRRSFLKTAGRGVVGLGAAATWFSPRALARVESAGRQVAGLAPEAVARDESYWFAIQQAFSVDRSLINLNNGGVCPSPRVVTEAVERYTWQQEEAPVYTMWQLLEPRSETVRAGLAELFGCDAEEIAITRNASESLEILLQGLPLERGDEVLTSTQDYPRMQTTLDQRARREGIAVRRIQVPVAPADPLDIVRAFEAGIGPRTKVILVCHVINLTGQIVALRPLCELARARGIEVVVDGAHSFAHFEFTQAEIGCDYFGTSLHKWLLAPKGTGMLYVRRDKIPRVWPLFAAPPEMDGDIRKFEEIGTHPASIRVATGDAIAFHRGIGGARKEARLRYLKNYWAERLRELPRVRFHSSFDPRQSCALFNVAIEGVDPEALGDTLWRRHRILTAAISHPECPGIRVTPNVYTSLEELDRFVGVMEQVARRGLPT